MAADKTTTLDTDITKPSVTAPGDGPADTTDPLERASTVVPRPSAETIASGAGTVNSQLPLEPIAPASTGRREKARTEEYDARDASGQVVRMERNIETGASRVKVSTDTGSTPAQSSGR